MGWLEARNEKKFDSIYNFGNYLTVGDQGLNLRETQSFHSSLQNIYKETLKLTEKAPKEILKLDIVAHRSKVNVLLLKTSEVYCKDLIKKVKRKESRKV